MSEEALVHPSQMIHQYTMFRRSARKPLPCFSVAMIPFFNWLSGDRTALAFLDSKIAKRTETMVDLFGDGTQFNFTQLNTMRCHWNLKQMIRACEGLGIAPFGDFIAYGDALYASSGTPKKSAWIGGSRPYN